MLYQDINCMVVYGVEVHWRATSSLLADRVYATLQFDGINVTRWRTLTKITAVNRLDLFGATCSHRSTKFVVIIHTAI